MKELFVVIAVIAACYLGYRYLSPAGRIGSVASEIHDVGVTLSSIEKDLRRIADNMEHSR